MSCGYVHAFWWITFEDGRSAASAPPGAGDSVRAVIADADPVNASRDEALEGRPKSAVEPALAAAGLPVIDNTFRQHLFACNGTLVKIHNDGECVPLADESIPAGAGLRLPDHCFPEGIVYGVVADGAVVSVACAHRSGPAGELVADMGVETAPALRRKGYARTAVSHFVAAMAARAGKRGFHGDGRKRGVCALGPGARPFMPRGWNREAALSARGYSR